MVFINSEGKFNPNTYLIDGQLYRTSGDIAIYVIENKGMRMMVDTSAGTAARTIVKKLKEFNLFPIHKLLLTHSHWDHVQGVGKLKKLIGDFEVLASEHAIDDLKNPERVSKPYESNVNSVENVISLKAGDIIDLNGLELEIFEFFGHSMDSIAILDKENKNIFIGDAVIYCFDKGIFVPITMPPDFNEEVLLRTFQKFRSMKDNFDAISLTHYGVWKDIDCDELVDKIEEIFYKTKEEIVKWYSKNPSVEYIIKKYYETFTPESKKNDIHIIPRLEVMIPWVITGLKMSGFIK